LHLLVQSPGHPATASMRPPHGEGCGCIQCGQTLQAPSLHSQISRPYVHGPRLTAHGTVAVRVSACRANLFYVICVWLPVLRIVISFGKLQVSSHCTSMAVRLYHDNHQQCQCPWQCRGTAAVTLCNMWRVQQHEHRVIYSNRDTVRVRVALHRSDLRASAAGGAPNEDIAASV
jgi:hypothetical protein